MRFGREKRVRDMGKNLGRNPYAFILDFDHDGTRLLV
jgi:hypothetical protein